ncbi:MAG: hypothetical protein SVY15_09970 [Halobacteriota archaeon]|nr:hypothetical protein [Halobacteriota archaeon]
MLNTKTKLLLVEPPKDYWFLMGEYLPPPTGLLALAAYVEGRIFDLEMKIIDCQAEVNKEVHPLRIVISAANEHDSLHFIDLA